jgi:hypothetical protein
MMLLLTKWLAHPQVLILVHFQRFWMATLIALITCAWLLRRYRGAAVNGLQADAGAVSGATTKSFDAIDFAFAILLAVFVCCFLYLIFYREDFACFDCDQLMDYSLVGRRFRMPMWPEAGRFFPLGLQEFNVLGHVSRTPAAYHSIAAVQLVLLAGILFAVLKECTVVWRALLVVAVIVTPSVVIPFTGLIYPERNVLFWLAILVLCLQRASSSRTSLYFIGCFVATHFLLYYKEPLVVLVVGYAASRIVMDFLSDRTAQRTSWRELAEKNIIPLGMTVVAGIYSVLFVVFMFPFNRAGYIREQSMDKKEVLLTFLRVDWLITLLVVVLAVRLVGYLSAGEKLQPLWDSLAVGAVAFLVAILGVGIYRDYYLAPVDLIAILYVGRLTALWVSKSLRLRAAIVGAACVCLLLHNAAYSTLWILERKMEIAMESQLAQFLKGYNGEPGQQQVELFFPLTDGYRLAEFSSYLNYVGVPVAGQKGHANEGTREFVVTGAGSYESGLCHHEKPYVCKHADEPGDGGLLIVLPTDVVEKHDLEQVEKSGMRLVSVAAWPEESSLGRWLRFLQVLSLKGGRHVLSQPWWQLHIFKKTMSTAGSGTVKPGELHRAMDRIPVAANGGAR